MKSKRSKQLTSSLEHFQNVKKILPDYIPAEGIFFFFFKIGNSMYSVEYFTNVPKNFGNFVYD